jgi:hypothetical protein
MESSAGGAGTPDRIVSGEITVWNAVTQGYPDFYGS